MGVHGTLGARLFVGRREEEGRGERREEIILGHLPCVALRVLTLPLTKSETFLEPVSPPLTRPRAIFGPELSSHFFHSMQISVFRSFTLSLKTFNLILLYCNSSCSYSFNFDFDPPSII